MVGAVLGAFLCAPGTPRFPPGPPETRRFCIGTSVLIQKHRLLRGPAARGRCLGQTKRRPRHPQPWVNLGQVNKSTGQRVDGATGNGSCAFFFGDFETSLGVLGVLWGGFLVSVSAFLKLLCVLFGLSCGPLGWPLGFLLLSGASQRVNESTGRRVNQSMLNGSF